MNLWTSVIFVLGLCCHQVYAQCSGSTLTLTADLVEFGFISSPNYPSNYPSNSACTWDVTAPAGAEVVLEFIEYNTECRYDFLYLYYDSQTSYNFRWASCTYGGDPSFSNLYHNTRFRLSFRSDGSVTKTGFKIRYFAVYESTVSNRFLPSSNCGDTFDVSTTNTYQIASPNFPSSTIGSFYSVTTCEVTFRASTPNTYMNVSVVWMDYSYTQNTGCTNGGLVLYKDSVTSANILESVCNEDSIETSSLILYPDSTTIILRYIASSVSTTALYGPLISVVAYTGSAVTSNAALPTVAAVNSACPSNFLDLTATTTLAYITTPRYPSDYSNYLNCGWRIQAPANHIVEVGLVSFSTESRYDVLTLSDGPTASYTTIQTFSGSYSSGYEQESTGRNMFVHFRSDSSVTNSGFKLYYRSVAGPNVTSSTCSVSFNPVALTAYDYSNYFVSHTGSTNYLSNAATYWLVTKSDETKSLYFRMVSFRTEANYDYLRVYKTHCPVDPVYSLSGDKTGQVYSVDYAGRYVLFSFQSDGSYTYSGFQIRYYQTEAPDSGSSADEDEAGGLDTKAIIGIVVGVVVVLIIITSCIKASRTTTQTRRTKPVVPSANKIASTLVIKTKPKKQPLPPPPPVFHPGDPAYPPSNISGQFPPGPAMSYAPTSAPAYPPMFGQTYPPMSGPAYAPIAPTSYQPNNVPSAFSYDTPAYPPKY